MASPFDDNSGSEYGIEIWRIEGMAPVRQAKDTYGKFYSGDCYIILNTYEKFGKKQYNLHFWLGKDSTQDEYGACAYMTVALDDKLGGSPVQFREVQNKESPEFLSLFPGIEFLDGGVDSAFNHVDPDAYEARLFQVKGKRNATCRQVAFSAKSMNHGDVFILDAGLNIWQWNGKDANRYEKAKALNVTTSLRNERGAKPEVFILDDGEETEEFWEELKGNPDDVLSTEDGGDDAKKEAEHEAVLFHVSDESGSMEFKEVGRGKLERDALKGDDIMILDTGVVVYVWVGKGANKDERKESMKIAEQHVKQSGRDPDAVQIRRVPQNGEPAPFKEHFPQWDPPRVWKMEDEKKPELAGPEASAMMARAKAEEEKMAALDGKVEVWRIENMDKVEWPKENHGQFFQGDSFIILYTYEKAGKPNYIIYFWQGKDSSSDEKAASALFAVEMDDALGGEPTQVRVVQNKEPNHFLALFAGKMVVHSGGCASGFKNSKEVDSYDDDGVSLFHVRGTNKYNTRAVQVAEVASSLNSGDCFVLLTPTTMYAWNGKGANDDEVATAASIAKVLQGNREIVTLAEGEEPEEFWAAIGGKDDYPQSKTLEGGAHEPRLFQCSTAYARKGHKMSVEEIPNFSQDDLCQDDVMILDTFDEVFVWIGHGSTKEEKEMSMELALDYVAQAAEHDGRDLETPVYRLEAGSEPPNFTCHFLGWSDEVALDFEDPYAKKMGALGLKAGGKKKKVALKQVTKESLNGPDPNKTFFSLEDLRNKTQNVLDSGVDIAKREQYLEPAAFQELFGMTKDEFNKLAKWKRSAAKKKHGLF